MQPQLTSMDSVQISKPTNTPIKLKIKKCRSKAGWHLLHPDHTRFGATTAKPPQKTYADHMDLVLWTKELVHNRKPNILLFRLETSTVMTTCSSEISGSLNNTSPFTNLTSCYRSQPWMPLDSCSHNAKAVPSSHHERHM